MAQHERLHRGIASGLLALAVVAVGATAPAGARERATTGSVDIVQAVPDASVTVTVDGKPVRRGASVGDVLGPYQLPAGSHDVRFSDAAGGLGMRAKLTVRPGSNTDVVLHRPAAESGKPVVNVYSTPRKPIGPGKARVVVAHTATVAPADVRVDGKTIFTNIANGEYATADVPAGKHSVALLPTGQTADPLLGPLDVTLPARTVTMVYAVGTPKNGSMSVISHDARIAEDGSVVPSQIKTGSAGLAAGSAVRPFSASDEASAPGGGPVGLVALVSLVVLGLAWAGLPVVRDRRPRHGRGDSPATAD